ncbi:MAG: rhodanese-like domain-containing protein [Gammaproteobacteria bacterium]|nr:rhodanese-like domain-containing protein [Gammaproteobacteria bacterium]
MRHMTAAQLRDYLELATPPPLLLDVRENWEYEICCLDNSLLIPMGQIPTKLELLNPEQEIVVICHHGIRSANVCHYLEHQGFDNMINLSGGVDAWARQVDINMAVY